jgi:Cu-Zn family superoxide dismutase
MNRILFAVVLIGVCTQSVHADSHGESMTVTVNSVTAEGVGASIGSITFHDTEKGLQISPKLTGLTPGDHGFHIHENPDCGPKEKDGQMGAALAAGPHFDPAHSGKHLGPHGGGHKGDLPKLEAGADGVASKTVVVPGVKVADIRNRSVMIHAGGDNYSDTPAPLGGGGARVACGVIK